MIARTSTYALVLCFLTGLQLAGYSQEVTLDSLLRKADDPSRIPESTVLILSEQLSHFEHPEDRALIHDRIASAYRKIGQLDSAAVHAWRVVRLVPDNLALACRAYQTLGFVAYAKELWERSGSFYEQSYRLSEKQKDAYGMMEAAMYLGRINFRLQQVAGARDEYEKALALANELTDQAASSQLTFEMVAVCRSLGDLRRAEAFLEEYIRMNAKDTARLADAYREFGQLDESKQEGRKAIGHYLTALRFDKVLSNPFPSFQRLSTLFMKMGSLDTAKLYADSAEATVGKLADIVAFRDCFQLRYMLAEQMKDTTSAYRFHLRYSLYDDSVKHREADRRVRQVRDELILTANEASIRTAELGLQLKGLREVQDRQWRNYQLFLAGAVALLALVIFLWLRTRMASMEQIRQSAERIKELQLSQEKLFTVVSHDLQGPVTTFSNLTRSIGAQLEKAGPDERNNLIMHLQASTVELRQSLNELLDWTVSQSGAMPCKPEVFSCRQLAGNVADDLHAFAEERGVGVNFLIPDIVMAHADKAMIRIVLRTMLFHAIRVSKDGDTVTIFSGQKDGLITLGIRDHGTAKWDGELQSDSALMDHPRNQGLGLPLCKDLVRRNGGELYLESGAGDGNNCFITLPQLPA